MKGCVSFHPYACSLRARSVSLFRGAGVDVSRTGGIASRAVTERCRVMVTPSLLVCPACRIRSKSATYLCERVR